MLRRGDHVTALSSGLREGESQAAGRAPEASLGSPSRSLPSGRRWPSRGHDTPPLLTLGRGSAGSHCRVTARLRGTELQRRLLPATLPVLRREVSPQGVSGPASVEWDSAHPLPGGPG